MDVSYSATATDIDKPAYDAQAERPDRPLRIRLQPTLLRLKKGETVGNHHSWSGVSWTLECRNAEEAIAVRRALEAFFGVIARHGAEQVEKALTATLAKQ
jgi:hypothetical protein